MREEVLMSRRPGILDVFGSLMLCVAQRIIVRVLFVALASSPRTSRGPRLRQALTASKFPCKVNG
jgi:hypothetical protein